MKKINRALIATHHLVNFAGSEIATLELATTLTSMGWEVTVAAMLIGEPMSWEFLSKSITPLSLLEPQPLIDKQHFDLVWIHHLPIFHEIVLARKITAERLVYCSLSPYEPLETVPVQLDAINILLANSRENAAQIMLRFGLPENSVKVFPNSAPPSFWEKPKTRYSHQLTKVLLVSNHPPTEILELKSHLKLAGKEVGHIGITQEETLVTPDQLNNYDAVITIGKTVQYCFALKIPVYCYDHFGGPGWLNEHNFELAYHNNFSGRGFSKKNCDSIIKELDMGYSEALAQLDRYYDFARTHFHLKKNLEQVLNYPLHSLPPFTGSTNLESLAQLEYYKRSILARQNSADTARTNSLHTEIRRLNGEIKRIKSSYSWILTKPLRLIVNLPRLIKLAIHSQ